MNLTLPTSAQLVIPGCVHVVPAWLSGADAIHLALSAELQSFMEPHRGFRGMPDQTRLTGRFGDPGVTYVYNGSRRKLHPFTPTLHAVRQQVVQTLGVPFNCAYVNLYTSGQAVLPRHSDIPFLPQLGQEPIIAAVSFGATRPFQLWSAAAPRNKSQMVQAMLGHGDLCIMHGRSQLDWLHGVPKAPGVTGSRLSLTFRFHHPA